MRAFSPGAWRRLAVIAYRKRPARLIFVSPRSLRRYLQPPRLIQVLTAVKHCAKAIFPRSG
jgi:hypothetical protein